MKNKLSLSQLITPNRSIINQKEFYLEGTFYDMTDSQEQELRAAGFSVRKSDWYTSTAIYHIWESQINDSPFKKLIDIQKLLDTGRYELVNQVSARGGIAIRSITKCECDADGEILCVRHASYTPQGCL